LGFLAQIVLPTLVPAQVGRAKANPGPRALGLLVLQPNGKAHLIPITILIDGQYYDASAYKASPVPMALWSQTVYEAVRTGVSQGLFTVTGALQQKDARDANEWTGEGTWQSAESLKAKAAKKPEPAEPRGLNQDEGPPVLRRSGAEKPKPTEAPAPSPTPPTAQPAPAASPIAAPAATSQAAPAAAPASPPAAVPSQTASAQEDKPPEDKDRPALKRGKPAPVQTEQPGKASATSAKAGGHTETTAPTTPSQGPATASGAAPGAQAANQVQLIPAISDSHGPDSLPYTFSMKLDEEQQFRKKMLAMAADEVRAHAGQLAQGRAAASEPVHASSQRRKTMAAKPVQPIFEDVRLRIFDLADINEPELVLTATARMPQRSREKENAGSELPYAITLVARQDVNGDFHKALANVTDAQHLDVLPRLELIDAVDADGDGRGELLFRQVSDAGSAFVVYRVIGDHLYPLFQGTPGR
jgi:hypothetical protein